MEKSDTEVADEAVRAGMHFYADFCRIRGYTEGNEKTMREFTFFSIGTLLRWMGAEIESQKSTVVEHTLRWPSESN